MSDMVRYGFLANPYTPGVLVDYYGNPLTTEASRYMPGVLANTVLNNQGGITTPGTDNYATIQAYLNGLTNGGANQLVLPPGPIGVSQTLVPPAGVILTGAGMTYGNSTPWTGGTVLVPLPGFVGNEVVHLSAVGSGLSNLEVSALAQDQSGAIPSAILMDAGQLILERVYAAGGTLYALNSTSSAPQCRLNLLFVNALTHNLATSTNGCINCLGDNWNITNFYTAGGSNVLGGNGSRWDAGSFLQNSMGVGTLVDLGGHTVTNVAVIGGETSAPWIDRTNAVAKSSFLGAVFIITVAGITGSPIIQETTTGGAGVTVIGAKFGTRGAGSTATYFIKGAIASSLIDDVSVPTGFLATAFADATPPLGVFDHCLIANAGVALGGVWPGTNRVLPTSNPSITSELWNNSGVVNVS